MISDDENDIDEIDMIMNQRENILEKIDIDNVILSNLNILSKLQYSWQQEFDSTVGDLLCVKDSEFYDMVLFHTTTTFKTKKFIIEHPECFMHDVFELESSESVRETYMDNNQNIKSEINRYYDWKNNTYI